MNTKFTYAGVRLSGIQTYKDATNVLSRMLEIVKDYDYATVADLKDLSGITSSYFENKLQWSGADIKCAYISEDKEGTYSINLPAPNDTSPNNSRMSTSYHGYSPVKTKHVKDPINITIDMGDLDDPDNTLAEVFKHVYTIEDRVVNIRIQ